MTDAPIKLGVLVWPQYTDWASLDAAGRRVDALGYDSLWTWDHLYPIVGSDDGPIFEGYLTLTAWARVTQRCMLGLMVGANTFRNPALVAKTVTTLDHVSGGRAYLGIGGAWFETEHTAYGIDFGRSPGERLTWLDEAVGIMRGMLHGERPSGRPDGRYAARSVRNDPPPVQKHLPILIGGGGERKTLHTVARYADAWNVGGDLETLRHKDEVLRRWCDEVGRDESEIERTLNGGAVILRDDPAEGRRIAAEIGRHNGGWPGPDQIFTPDQFVESLAPRMALGFRHVYIDSPAPFDDESLERMATEVRPMLEQELAARA